MRQSIILLFFAVAGCSNPAPVKNEIAAEAGAPGDDIPASAIREKFADSPEMEKITINDAQGILAFQGILVNGKKEGAWTEFNNNGSVKSVTPFVHGKKEGLYLELNSNGQFGKRIAYHNDLRHGEYAEYNYPNKKEERMYRQGKLEGTVKIYYSNGKIMEEGAYKNDTRDGISRWFNEEGKETIKYEYKNGELVKK